MKNEINFLEWFETHPPKEKRYNHTVRERVSGRGMGAVGKFFYPDFIAEVMYYTDPKTGKLADDWKAVVQQDGLVMGVLNFRKDTMVKKTFTKLNSLHFEIEVNVKFINAKLTGTIKLGSDKFGGELSAEGESPQIHSTLIITGDLNATTGKLTVSGRKF